MILYRNKPGKWFSLAKHVTRSKSGFSGKPCKIRRFTETSKISIMEVALAPLWQGLFTLKFLEGLENVCIENSVNFIEMFYHDLKLKPIAISKVGQNDFFVFFYFCNDFFCYPDSYVGFSVKNRGIKCSLIWPGRSRSPSWSYGKLNITWNWLIGI